MPLWLCEVRRKMGGKGGGIGVVNGRDALQF
jgi:hypothetical protein